MYNTKDMVELGFAFMNAAETNFLEGHIKDRSVFQNVAGAVNLAFACELFMKSLLNIAGKENKKHKLEEIWCECKEACEDKTSEIESLVMTNIKTDLPFEGMLQDVSNVFYNYRYLYEPDRLAEIRENPMRLQFLRWLAMELYNYLRSYLENE